MFDQPTGHHSLAQLPHKIHHHRYLRGASPQVCNTSHCAWDDFQRDRGSALNNIGHGSDSFKFYFNANYFQKKGSTWYEPLTTLSPIIYKSRKQDQNSAINWLRCFLFIRLTFTMTFCWWQVILIFRLWQWHNVSFLDICIFKNKGSPLKIK